MFERRVPRAELERRLDEAGPYLDLAKQIGEEAAKLAIQDTADTDTIRISLGEIVTRMVGKERQRLVLETFQTLPDDEKARLLLQVFGDQTLRVALETQRVEANKQAIAKLAEIGKETGSLDLTLLPFRSALSVVLCDQASYEEYGASPELYEEATVARRLTLAHLGQARFHVLDDRIRSSYSLEYYPETDDQQIMELGILLDEGTPDERLEHVIYANSSLGSSIDGGSKFEVSFSHLDNNTLLVVGDADINGVHILGGYEFAEE